MPQANLLNATGDVIIATQTRFQASTLKAKTALFAEQVRTTINVASVPIINWCTVIHAASSKMVSASGTLIEANAMGLLLYRCLSLADALPTLVLPTADKTAILAAYNAHLTSV